MKLPWESIHKIALSLATPNNPLQYGYDDETLQTLMNLSLTSRRLHHFIRPCLFRSLRVQPRQFEKLNDVFTNNPDLLVHVVALYFWRPEEDEDEVPEWLAGIFETLTKFIIKVRPTLRRICLDVPLPEEPLSVMGDEPFSELFHAIEDCYFLEEFGCLRSDMPIYACDFGEWFVNWRYLQRLVLSEYLLREAEEKLLLQLPRLRVVVLYDCGRTGGEHFVMQPVKKMEGRLRCVQFDHSAQWCGWSKDREAESQERLKPGERTNWLEVLKVLTVDDEQEWFTDKVVGGSIWSLPKSFDGVITSGDLHLMEYVNWEME